MRMRRGRRGEWGSRGSKLGIEALTEESVKVSFESGS